MRNAKGDLKQIREINCLHTFDEFASEALPYWIERAERLERALRLACIRFGACPSDVGEPCQNGDCKDPAACWKKFFMEESK